MAKSGDVRMNTAMSERRVKTRIGRCEEPWRRVIRRCCGNLALVIAALTLGFAADAEAAVSIWSGGSAASGNWTLAANWSNNVAPVAGNDLIFPPGAARLSNNNDFPANTAFQSITFSGTGYTILGNGLQLTNGILAQHASGSNTVTPELTLAAPQSFVCSVAGATLVVTAGRVLLGTNNLTVGGAGQTRIPGSIQGTGGVIKTNSGTLTLEGTLSNFHSGGTTVNEGTLLLSKSFSGFATAIPGPLTVGDGIGGTNADVVRLTDLAQIADSAAVTVNSSGLLELVDNTDAIGSLTVNGGNVTTRLGTLLLNGDVTASRSALQAATISGRLALGTAMRTFTVSGFTLPGCYISGQIGGNPNTPAGITKAGGGVLVLAGSNSYPGLTIVSAGVLQLESAFALGLALTGTVVNPGGSLVLRGGVHMTNSEPLTLNGGGFPFGALTSLEGSNSWAGNITLNSTSTVRAHTFTDVLRISGAISGPGGLTKTGDGDVFLAGASANSYSGATAVNAGVLSLGKSAGINAVPGALTVGAGFGTPNSHVLRLAASEQIANTADVVINDTGLLDLNGFSETIASLSGSRGNVSLGAASGTLILGPTSTNTTFGGVISGSGSVVKNNSVTFTLFGANTYTGATVINFGRLLVNGSQPTSPVTVNPSGTLGGFGRVGVINAVGGTVSPGASPGVLSSSNAVFNASATTVIEINGAFPGGHDQLRVQGDVDLGNSRLNATLTTNFFPMQGDRFVIIDNDGTDPVTGTFGGLPEGATVAVDGLPLRISYTGGSGNDVVLSLSTPPVTAADISLSAGNGNGAIDPNECNDLRFAVLNQTANTLTGIIATLSSTTPGVIITQAGGDYPSLAPGTRGTNITPFQIQTTTNFLCGRPIELVLSVVIPGMHQFNLALTLLSGSAQPRVRFDNDAPLAIPEGFDTNSVITVSNITSAISKVTVSLFIAHPNAGDLVFALSAPDGSTVYLAYPNGAAGANYGTNCVPDGARTTFDDDAATSITSALAPFVGVFQPQQPLAQFAGLAPPTVNGEWKLYIVDNVTGNTGMLNCWSLELSPTACADGGGGCEPCAESFTSSITASDPVQTGVLRTFGFPFRCGTMAMGCPGVTDPLGFRHYDAYTFTNTQSGSVCVTVSLEASCVGMGVGVGVVAYLGSFNPANICANFRADSSQHVPASFSFDVPGGLTVVLVVHELQFNAGCPEYTLAVTGLSCPAPVLRISDEPDTTEVLLRWTTGAPGFQLEATPTLSPINFQPVTEPPVVVNGKYTVTNNSAGASRFYRLRK